MMLIVRGAGALLIARHGTPTALEIFVFATGGVAGTAAAALAALGHPLAVWEPDHFPRLAFGAVHLLSFTTAPAVATLMLHLVLARSPSPRLMPTRRPSPAGTDRTGDQAREGFRKRSPIVVRRRTASPVRASRARTA